MIKEELISAIDGYSLNNTGSNLRYIYDNLVDFMYETDCYIGGMFESYGVVLDFKNIEQEIMNGFELKHVSVIIETLEVSNYTPLSKVLSSYLKARLRVRSKA